MRLIQRITMDPDVMGGRPCIRGMRVTVGMILEALAAGRTEAEILNDFPYLVKADLRAAKAFRKQADQRLVWNQGIVTMETAGIVTLEETLRAQRQVRDERFRRSISGLKKRK